VFRIALTLAIGALSLDQPAASIATGAAMTVWFAPEEDCAAFVVRAIDNAERQILVSAYGLTVGSGIVGSLIRARERRSGPHDSEVGRVARRPGAPSSPQTGTEGSPPLPPLPRTLGFL
jgi:hypothetical protein